MTKNKLKPADIQISVCKDGGATVTAMFDFHTLYCRAFSNSEEARMVAAQLFDREFDMPKEEEFYEPNF